jgi:hypothetical protein
LLAGPVPIEAHDQVVQELMRILEAQRIISLDTLFNWPITWKHCEARS